MNIRQRLAKSPVSQLDAETLYESMHRLIDCAAESAGMLGVLSARKYNSDELADLAAAADQVALDICESNGKLSDEYRIAFVRARLLESLAILAQAPSSSTVFRIVNEVQAVLDIDDEEMVHVVEAAMV